MKLMKKEKVIYYKDELNEEFSTVKIKPKVIDENYKYVHKDPLWNLCSYLVQNVLSVPIKNLYSSLKFRIKYIGKGKIKKYKKQGYFIFANHTQPFADTFLPSRAVYPKRNYFIVNPENVSMKGLRTLVEMLRCNTNSIKLKSNEKFFGCYKIANKTGT